MNGTAMVSEQRLAYMRRVAIVFSAEIRKRIVTELYQREMSAKQFFEEHGGGSIARVDRHFKRLAEHGWLRRVRSEGPDSKRRGGREHFYRAPELAILDNESWALLPYSVRTATSWKTVGTLGDRVREAALAETLDARAGDGLRCHAIDIDEPGWSAVIGAVDACFEAVFEEQVDARTRMFHSGERPMVATIALAAFRSPLRSEVAALTETTTPRLAPAPKESPMPFFCRLSKVMGDPLSLMILNEANRRDISAPILTRQIGVDYQWIRRRVKALEEFGWLRRVGEEKQRNGSAFFYRATVPAFVDQSLIPAPARLTPSWNSFQDLSEAVKRAILAGTLEAVSDSHLSWSVLRLDERGWASVAHDLADLLAFVTLEKERAEKRRAYSDSPSVGMTVGLGAFESPAIAAREP